MAAEQFDLVQRRLAANQRNARRNTTHPYLLRALVSCGVCRLACTGVTRTATDTRYLRPRELLPGAVHPRHPAG